jgi:hypothetical protein
MNCILLIEPGGKQCHGWHGRSNNTCCPPKPLQKILLLLAVVNGCSDWNRAGQWQFCGTCAKGRTLTWVTATNGENLMRTRLLLAAVTAAVLAPGIAFAQGSTAGGAVGGAVVGGAVGGPVGAAIGAGVGATVGAAAEPPAEVTTYVARERVPSVAVREEVVIGQPLPRTVKLRTIPRHREYSYAVVNDRRIIVEPKTRRVIKIIE